jgi:translation initiation factor 3 subunit D
MSLSFLPELKESPLGWGPPEEQVFFQDVPYAPFTKNERLGKAADWTNSRQQYQRTFFHHALLVGNRKYFPKE